MPECTVYTLVEKLEALVSRFLCASLSAGSGMSFFSFTVSLYVPSLAPLNFPSLGFVRWEKDKLSQWHGSNPFQKSDVSLKCARAPPFPQKGPALPTEVVQARPFPQSCMSPALPTEVVQVPPFPQKFMSPALLTQIQTPLLTQKLSF